jgi:hypothetical protein
MRIKNVRVSISATLIFCSGWLALSASGFENVNMAPLLSVEGGSVVVRWAKGGFDHFNIRWSANGGPQKQVERDGDKDFLYVTPYRPGVVYRVGVQGCEKGFGGGSQCTSWDEITCGPQSPCDSTSRPPPPPPPKTSNACRSGYVWRLARAQDLVCVIPTSRDHVAQENRTASQRWNPAGASGPKTCVSGYVWREAFQGDTVCVSPQRRAEVKKENMFASARRAPQA